MKTRWVQHLSNKEDQDVMRAEVLSARPVLDRLKQLLNDDIAAIDEKLESEEFLRGDNLTERYAAQFSGRAALRRIIKLIEV